MTTSGMVAFQWADVPHISEVDALSPDDRACLEDVRAVLARHGRLDKFGVALLHHHFPLDDTEVFVESIDLVGRTLTATATPVAALAGDMIETMWRFGSDEGDVRPVMQCQEGSPAHEISDPHPRPSPPSPSPDPSPEPSPLPGPTRPGSPSAPDPEPSPNPSPGQ